MIGLRRNVGADWRAYEAIFQRLSFAGFSALDAVDPAYKLLNLLAAGLGFNVWAVMYCDAVTYLPDDILAKVDRASMAVSLETRVPFLDHRVAELAARIPLDLKVRDGRGKHLVRKLLYGMVPRELVERPKAGFALPVGEWIKGPLRPWAEDLLNPEIIKSQGWFDADMIASRWRQHLSGQRDSTAAIWAILMFQSWLEAQSRQAPASLVRTQAFAG